MELTLIKCRDKFVDEDLEQTISPVEKTITL